ncbi:MAG: endonuclease/exonuclease/phosphatase family protein [Burkholderiales bacterium]|nr:endonuclease/exonuclease/phosphatase family protein [Burkholderiales bacterium]
MMNISIATYNIHKGVSQFFRAPTLNDLRRRLDDLDADIVFLQEVCGKVNTPPIPEAKEQYVYIAQQRWRYAYGKNAVTKNGHHGNALLSRYPIVSHRNEDISAHWLERRGLLHCELYISDSLPRLHCLNVHLGLFESWRKHQLTFLVNYIKKNIPDDEPLLIAGDFNDWNKKGHAWLSEHLSAMDAFEGMNGAPARTFPSFLPILPLDRIYVRGLRVCDARVHYDDPYTRVSDHAAISADLELAAA